MVKLSTDRKIIYCWNEPTSTFYMVLFVEGKTEHPAQVERARDWRERELYRDFVAGMPEEHVFTMDDVGEVNGGAV